MIAAKVALRPKNEAPRKTWPGLRGAANFINSNDATDTIPPLQLQCLARYGVTGAQAAMLASLIWPDGGNAPWGGAA